MEADTSEFYEREAETYDEGRFASPVGMLTDTMQKEIVLRSFDLNDTPLLLDVGTGTGRFAIEFAKNGAIVIGLDPSKAMIKLARRKSLQGRVDGRINLVVAAAHKLPFKTNSFDCSVSINVLNHISDYTKVLVEIARVLKQKGYFVANFPSMQSFYLPVALFINFRKRALFRNVYSRWFTLGEIRESFSEAGLSIQDISGFPVLASPPLPKEVWFSIIRIMKKKGISFSSSALKYLSGCIFIKSQKTVERK